MQHSAPPPISEQTSRYGHQENTFDKMQRSAPPPIPDGTNAYDEVLRLRDELMVHSHACTHTHKHTQTRAYYHTHRQSLMNMNTHVSFSPKSVFFTSRTVFSSSGKRLLSFDEQMTFEDVFFYVLLQVLQQYAPPALPQNSQVWLVAQGRID